MEMEEEKKKKKKEEMDQTLITPTTEHEHDDDDDDDDDGGLQSDHLSQPIHNLTETAPAADCSSSSSSPESESDSVSSHPIPSIVNGGGGEEHHSKISHLQLDSPSKSSSVKKLNAEAPEFVPRATIVSASPPSSSLNSAHPVPGLLRVVMPPQLQIYPLHNSAPAHYQDHHASSMDHNTSKKDELTEELTQKIVNQVEYYFSDANLATNDYLMRFINKDPEGYVPMSVIASFKKIKSLASGHSVLAAALRMSSKLVVSEDGKRVKRLHPLSDADIEELQSRTVVVENLPEDHSHANLENIFASVGSVKTVRICYPQASNGATPLQGRSPKFSSALVSNKMHAFVELETLEQAEKAANELNDERNWRSGLKVRMLQKCMTKPATSRSRKGGPDGDFSNAEDEGSPCEHANDDKHHDEHFQQPEVLAEHSGEEGHHDKEAGGRRVKGKGRGKGRGRGNSRNRGAHPVGTPPCNNVHTQAEPSLASVKHPPGPRMPDGTRGFTMGRGKHLSNASESNR